MSIEGKVRVVLKDAAINSTFESWCLTKNVVQSEYATIALAAIATNKRVFARKNTPDVGNSVLEYFGVVKYFGLVDAVRTSDRTGLPLLAVTRITKG